MYTGAYSKRVLCFVQNVLHNIGKKLYTTLRVLPREFSFYTRLHEIQCNKYP